MRSVRTSYINLNKSKTCFRLSVDFVDTLSPVFSNGAVLLFFSDGVVDKCCGSETVYMASFRLNCLIYVVYMSVAYPNGAAGSSAEFVVMSLVGVCCEAYLVHMVIAAADGYCFICYNGKSVVVRLYIVGGKLYAS